MKWGQLKPGAVVLYQGEGFHPDVVLKVGSRSEAAVTMTFMDLVTGAVWSAGRLRDVVVHTEVVTARGLPR